jgi:two-component system cell cycle response regulator
MARKHKQVRSSGRTVLLADDDLDYLEATRLLLESEGHVVRCAENGPRALRLLREQGADLLLLDYFMPGMTGEEVVTRLREFDPYIQVVLQTGYSDEQPPREMLRNLDIQGYYDKSEGPEKLLLWTDAGLKAADVLRRVQRSREGLRYVLQVTPDLHKVQPVGDLLECVLRRFIELLRTVEPRGAPDGAEAAEPCAFLAMLREDSELSMRASTGRFQGCVSPNNVLEPAQATALIEALRFGEIRTTDTATIVPLRVGDLTLGVLFAERRCTSPQTVELLGILANQATVAIQNMQLYEVAALDPLTGVHARRFFEQWMRREVRTAFRSRKHTSILLIDVDGMKSINDSAGHLVGDQALAITGQALRSAVRGNDVVGRYGGDEFIVLLPETAAARAQKVALRILAAFEDKRVPGTSDRMPLRCSIGLGELEPRPEPATALRRPVPATYFQRMAQALIANCAQALLRARAQGGGRLALGEPTAWAEIPDTGEGL